MPIAFPNPQTKLFKKFCSAAVGLLSSRNNFVCKEKEIRNLPQRISESDWQTQKKKYLEERIPPVTQNKNWRQNKKPLSYTPFVQLVFCPTKPSLYPLQINKLLLYPSIVLTLCCFIRLLFNPSIVRTFFYISIVLLTYCSTPLLFNTSIVLTSYCLNLPLF